MNVQHLFTVDVLIDSLINFPRPISRPKSFSGPVAQLVRASDS